MITTTRLVTPLGDDDALVEPLALRLMRPAPPAPAFAAPDREQAGTAAITTLGSRTVPGDTLDVDAMAAGGWW